MFEEEAKEYADEKCGTIETEEKKFCRLDWQKGAEFGYNKANEWNYPSKGELPKCDEKTQLIFYVNYYYEMNGETITRKRTVLGYYQNSFLNDDVKLFVEKSKGYEDEHLPKDVIAWKEIVLPKEV